MLKGHRPLQDQEVIDYINKLFKEIGYQDLEHVKYEQLDRVWRQWLTTDTYNNIIGLDSFKYSAFCPGTTDAFGEFIARYSNRRIRVSRSDFILTKILANTYSKELVFLEQGPLESNDCIIISYPYSGNGSEYPKQDELLDSADQLGVPVFIDGAYYGISYGVTYPLDRKCVVDFAVSLTKNMVGDPLRLGIRFTKEPVDDCITAGLLGSDIYDKLGTFISIKLLERFPQSWLLDKYKTYAEVICSKFNLQTTKTITLALGDSTMYEYKRGDYVRLCITDELNEYGKNYEST